MFEGIYSRWLLSVIVQLVVLQSAYELWNKEDRNILVDLPYEGKAVSSGPAKRIVLTMIQGLHWELYNEKAHQHHFYKNVKDKLGTNGACLSYAVDPLRQLKEMMTGVPGIGLDDDVESLYFRAKVVYFGPPSVASILGRDIVKECFPPEWENETLFPFPRKLDEWIMNAVEKLLQDSQKSQSNLNLSEKQIIMIYVPGIDMLNKLYGVDSTYAIEELFLTMSSLSRIYHNLEAFFNDSNTGYVLTATHGVSSSYDLMNISNAKLPFITWGAGFCNKDDCKKVEHMPYRNINDVQIYDIASLIASVLGINIPCHSLGIAPLYCLKDDRLRAKVSLSNAKQINHLCKEFESKLAFGWACYLSPLKSFMVDKLIKEAEDSFSGQDFISSVASSQKLISLSLDSIAHYKQYKNRNIAACVLLSLVGWTAVTLGWVLKKIKITPLIQQELHPQPVLDNSVNSVETRRYCHKCLCNPEVMVDIVGLVGFLGTLSIMVFVSSPLSVTAVCLLTVFMVWLVVKELFEWTKLYRANAAESFRASTGKPVLHLVAFIIFIMAIEYPILLNLGLMISIVFSCLSDLRRKSNPYLTFWTLSSLPFFLLLHSDLEVPNFHYLVFCAFLWIIVSFFLCYMKPLFFDWSLLLVGNISIFFVIFRPQDKLFSKKSAQLLGWAPLALISFIPLIGSSNLSMRLLQICSCLCVHVAYFSKNFEILSLLAMLLHISSWLFIEGFQSFGDFLSSSIKFSSQNIPIAWSDIRRSVYYTAYVITSFLSISSSDDISLWSNSCPAFMPLPKALMPFCCIFLKAFPIILLVNIPIVLIGRHNPSGYQALKMFISAIASFFHILLKADYVSNVCLQFILLLSFLAEPFSWLLLCPSLFSMIIKSKFKINSVAMRKKEPSSVETPQ